MMNLFVLLIIGIVIYPSSDQTVQAYSVGNCVQAPSGGVNFRSSPQIGNNILFTSSAYEQFTYRSGSPTQSNGYTWLPLSGRGYSGWAANEVVTPCPSPPPPPPTPQIKWTQGECLATPSGGNIRSGAGLTASVLFVSDPGEQFTVRSGIPVYDGTYTWYPLNARTYTNAWAADSILAGCPPPPPPAGSCGNIPWFHQNDYLDLLGNCATTTIKQSGCVITSLAMATHMYGYDFTPPTLNNWLKAHGGFAPGDCNLYWGSTASLGIVATKVASLTASQLTNLVNNCQPVIAHIIKNGSTHYILITGTSGAPASFDVHDPGYGSITSYPFTTFLDFIVYNRPGT